MPLGLLFAGLLVCVLKFTKARLRWILLSVWAFFLVLSNPLGEQAFLGVWELPLTSQDAQAPADALVVLGGSVDPVASAFLGDSQVQVNETAERLTEALRYVRLHPGTVIVVSGGSGVLGHQGEKEAPYMKRFLVELGADPAAIIEEPDSRNTAENLKNVVPICAQKGYKRIEIVTSAFHARRSEAIAARAFADTPGLSWKMRVVDSLRRPLSFPDCVVPTVLSLKNTTAVIKEMIGYAAYKIFGFL